MTTITKKSIVACVAIALSTASFRALFDYIDGVEINVFKLTGNAVFMGTVMSLLFRYNLIKNQVSKNDEQK